MRECTTVIVEGSSEADAIITLFGFEIDILE